MPRAAEFKQQYVVEVGITLYDLRCQARKKRPMSADA
jgi:hypothetical protein